MTFTIDTTNRVIHLTKRAEIQLGGTARTRRNVRTGRLDCIRDLLSKDMRTVIGGGVTRSAAAATSGVMAASTFRQLAVIKTNRRSQRRRRATTT